MCVPVRQWLVLWLDCDREGENIACDIRDVCCAVNPRLRVFRGRFSALIPQDIYNAGRERCLVCQDGADVPSM